MRSSRLRRKVVRMCCVERMMGRSAHRIGAPSPARRGSSSGLLVVEVASVRHDGDRRCSRRTGRRDPRKTCAAS
jgi:hypothetical protein